jgi:hypothetical protein
VTAFDKRPATTSKRPRGCAVCCLTLLARTRPTGARRGVQNTAIWAAGPPAVLDATVALLEEGMDLPEVVDIAERAAVAVEDVARAVRAMERIYLDLQITMGDSGRWYVKGVTPKARRAVGQWPIVALPSWGCGRS